MKSKDLQPRLLYPARLSLKIEGEIKSFPDKKKLKVFVTAKQCIRTMLRALTEKEKKKGDREITKEYSLIK